MHRPKSLSWLLGWASLGAVTLLYWANLRELPMRLAWQFFPTSSSHFSGATETGAIIPSSQMLDRDDENSDEPEEIQVAFGGVATTSDWGTENLSSGGLTPRSAPAAAPAPAQSGNVASGDTSGNTPGGASSGSSGGGAAPTPESPAAPTVPPSSPNSPSGPVAGGENPGSAGSGETPGAGGNNGNNGGSGNPPGGIEVVIPIQNPLNGEPLVEIAVRENLIPTLLDLNRGEKISLNFLSLGGDEDGPGARSIELTVLGDEVVLNHSDQIALLDALGDGDDDTDAEKIPIKFQVNHDQGNLELQLPDSVRENFDIELAIQGEDREESSILAPVESLLHINLPLI